MDILKNQALLSFLYDGKPCTECSPAVTNKCDGNKTVTEYIFGGGLKVTNTRIDYPDFDACEWVNCFENTSDAPTGIISELFDCDADIPFAHDDPLRYTAYQPDPAKNMKIYAPTGSTWRADEFYCNIDDCEGNNFLNHIYPGQKKKYCTSGGRSSESRAPFFNIFRQNNGVIFAVGWTGQWNCMISRGTDSVNIKTGIEGTNFRLMPGEKIRTSSFVMMRYSCDEVEAQNKWRRFIKDKFSIIGEGKRADHAPLCASIWGGMTTDAVLERIDIIKKNKLPFEYIWMDAGWYGDSEKDSPDEFEGDWFEHTGDWRINKKHHPDGLLQVSRAIKSAGMKFLLWFEPERVIRGTPITKEHPEYFIESPDPNDRNMLLNLGNEQAWQYCFETISSIIEKLNIDCYRQDFNFSPLGFWRKNDAEDRRGITEIKHINGMYRLWDALLQKFPSLIIDNCASGGRRIDIETLKRSVPLWRSDYQCPANFTIEASQAHNINFGAWMPYSGSGSGREWGDLYRFRSAYACSMTTNYAYSQRDSFGDPEQLAWIKKYGEEYLRARPFFSCDLYPLTSSVSGNDAWCAAQYNRPERADGIVQIFKRADSPYINASFVLRGLENEKIYIFTDADGGEESEFSGAELRSRGFPVEITEKRVAKLYFYRVK